MILKRCKIFDFGSYEVLDLDLSDPGLILIHGPTGSGKSTAFDAPTWILFGKTAKDGVADDILPWFNDNAVSHGILEVEVNGVIYHITRKRGKGANDLYYNTATDGDTVVRGKDLTDTQKLINSLINTSYEEFVNGAYFHEFTPSSGFFTAKAKERRELLNQLVSYPIASTLTKNLVLVKKIVKGELETARLSQSNAEGAMEQATKGYTRAISNSHRWQESHDNTRKLIQNRLDNFALHKQKNIEEQQLKKAKWDADKSLSVKNIENRLAEITRLKKDPGYFDRILENLSRTAKCRACDSLLKDVQERIRETVTQKTHNGFLLKEENELLISRQRYDNENNPYTQAVVQATKLENTYEERLKEHQEESNPYVAEIQFQTDELKNYSEAYDTASKAVMEQETHLNTLEHLSDLLPILRAEMLKRIVKILEEKTNDYLDRFFDSELRVQFDTTNTDNLDTTVYKSGYECSYTQLSKGQRALLKLCFAAAIMKLVNTQSGTHFSTLFFDEPTDGCDEELKVKAFALFQELALEHQSIFIIEHSPALKTMFEKRLKAEIEGDRSKLVLDE